MAHYVKGTRKDIKYGDKSPSAPDLFDVEWDEAATRKQYLAGKVQWHEIIGAKRRDRASGEARTPTFTVAQEGEWARGAATHDH